MELEDRNKFVDIEPYLIPETRLLLNEIESKISQKVMLRKVYDSLETWQVRKTIPYQHHIDMPENDEGNIIGFTHELLHIYFDYVLDMKLSDLLLPNITLPYNQYYKNPWELYNHFITLINNLQHHKMIPYFIEYKFPLDKIINNFYAPSNIYEALDNTLSLELNFKSELYRYLSALLYVNFLSLEMYFPNPKIREELSNKYALLYDKKFIGLRSIFYPILEKWDKECNNSRELILEINNKAKGYANNV